MPTLREIQEKIAEIKKECLVGEKTHADEFRPLLTNLDPRQLVFFMTKASSEVLELFADQLKPLLTNLELSQLNYIVEKVGIVMMMQLFPTQFEACIPQEHKKKFGSCFKTPSDLKELDKYPVDRDHPIVAQSFCDTKVLLPDGRIVTLENQFAGSVYKHLKAQAGQHTLTVYADAGHAFFNLDENSYGFWPYGKLGEVCDELPAATKECQRKYAPAVTFVINENQCENVSKFVNDTKTTCNQGNCTYHSVYRNCVIFTIEAFGKAFPGKHYLPFFRDQIPDLLSLIASPLTNPEESTPLFERFINYYQNLYNIKAWVLVRALMDIEQIDAMPDDCLHCLSHNLPTDITIAGESTPEKIPV